MTKKIEAFNVSYTFVTGEGGKLDETAQATIKAIKSLSNKQDKTNPDLLKVDVEYKDVGAVVTTANGKKSAWRDVTMHIPLKATRLYAVIFPRDGKDIKALAFTSKDGKIYALNCDDKSLFDAIDKRNSSYGWALDTTLAKPSNSGNLAKVKVLSADTNGGKYGVHTSQEVQAMGYLLTDGATGANFTKNEAEGMVLHQREGVPFRVALSTQRQDGKPLETLDDIMQEISEIGGIQALKEFNYILWQLIPAEGETFAEGWLDFGDIWKYTGKSSRSKAARLEAYEHIWRVIKFCEQAEVFGARKGKYLIDGKEIDTTITGQPFWHISQKEYNEGETIPAKALLTTPPIMRKLLHTPQLQQYLGYGHLIGGIPSGRAAGAWAVSIGLTFLNHLRINLANGHNLTRRTLLSKYPSEISPYTEVLESDTPRRAIKYWVDALQILCEQGLIQKEGEALATVKSIRKGLPRYDWQEQFLNQSVVLIPSTRDGLKKAIDDIAKNKYKPKPKNLKAPKRRKKV